MASQTRITSQTICWCGHHWRYHGGSSCAYCDKKQLNEPHAFPEVVTTVVGGVTYKSLTAPMKGGAFGDIPPSQAPSKPRRLPQTSSKIVPYRSSHSSQTPKKSENESERATRVRSPHYDGSGKWVSEYHWKPNNNTGFDLHASVIFAGGGLILGIVAGIWVFIVDGYIPSLVGCPIAGLIGGLFLGHLYDEGLEKRYREKYDSMHRLNVTESNITVPKIIECLNCYAHNFAEAEFCSNCGEDL